MHFRLEREKCTDCAFSKILSSLVRTRHAYCLPDGRSYKREEDGIVLERGLVYWMRFVCGSCPYGAREMDPAEGVMKKCTLCVDRIYNENIPEEDRARLRPDLPN